MKRLMLLIGVAATIAVVGCKKSVPKLEGQDLKSATSKLEDIGFKLGSVNKTFTGTSESGTVVHQNPAAASKMPKGSSVDLTIEESITLPALVGQDVDYACRALELEGLHVKTRNQQSKDAKSGTVTGQLPMAGKRVAAGTEVELYIAGGSVLSDLVNGTSGKDKDPHGLIKGVGNLIQGELDRQIDRATDKATGKASKDTGKASGKDTGKASGKDTGKAIGTDASKDMGDLIRGELDKQIDKEIDKQFGKGIGTDAAKDAAKGVSKDIRDGLISGVASLFSSKALPRPAQLSPVQKETVNAVGGRVNFVWAEVLGAASYTVEIEAHSGKKWVKQEKKSGLIETKYSAIIAAPEARWRVCAVDNKQKDGKQSDWATFNLIGSQESASKPVQSPNQPPQVVSK